MLSRVRLFVTLWTVARQAPLSMRFSSQECWSGLSRPPPEDLPNPGIELASLMSPALAGRFLTMHQVGKRPEFNLLGRGYLILSLLTMLCIQHMVLCSSLDGHMAWGVLCSSLDGHMAWGLGCDSGAGHILSVIPHSHSICGTLGASLPSVK